MVDKIDEVPILWHPKRLRLWAWACQDSGGLSLCGWTGPSSSWGGRPIRRALPGPGQHSHRLITVASVSLFLKLA